MPRSKKVLAFVRERGCVRVSDVAVAFGITRPSAARHLRKLRDMGLVRAYALGPVMYYCDGDLLTGLSRHPKWRRFVETVAARAKNGRVSVRLSKLLKAVGIEPIAVNLTTAALLLRQIFSRCEKRGKVQVCQ
ncbi:winged helix-turn-helix domain-containing protein [Pyrobaculum aerophilum]|uniref:winged helix-turn-helix domain-containing protein n=1 Tax=Pyrobaculum aerophilum TaxID=13773 RepID=UPI002FDA6A0E